VSPTFADLGVPAELVAALSSRDITTPFPIQAATLREGLAGRDLCGRAPTGSGKTLAFGIALAARVAKARPGAPRALVLVPTRELAEQVRKELEPLCAARGRTIATIYGGVGFEPQRRALRRGVDVVVACPGRLADLVKQGDVSLTSIDFVVVDEADRMADMGFLPEVRRLLDRTSPQRQTLLYSATLDGDVDVLVRRYQKNPARHEVESEPEELDNLEHRFLGVSKTSRLWACAGLIRELGSTIVFTRTKHGADRLSKQLEKSGVSATAIHGGRSQGQRDRALESFHRGKVAALVATDVAARGIHVEGIACVVHYDPPGDEKDYVHRSGRTARAGARGVVVSLVQPDQVADMKRLQDRLGLPRGFTHQDAPRERSTEPILQEERDYPRPPSRNQPLPAESPRDSGRKPARRAGAGTAPWKRPGFQSDAPRGPQREWGAGLEDRAARDERNRVPASRGSDADKITHEPHAPHAPAKRKSPAWHRGPRTDKAGPAKPKRPGERSWKAKRSGHKARNPR
jgi:superfamily II DNA/RNA helicase